MIDPLGKRIYREYCWFALMLVALLIGVASRVASTQLSAAEMQTRGSDR
jgi:hypothetical protein